MVRYLISCPASAMDISAEDLPGVAEAARGINEDVEPVMVAEDGAVTRETYPQIRGFSGGFTVVEVSTRQEALDWAAKIAVACRCPREVREFQADPRA